MKYIRVSNEVHSLLHREQKRLSREKGRHVTLSETIASLANKDTSRILLAKEALERELLIEQARQKKEELQRLREEQKRLKELERMRREAEEKAKQYLERIRNNPAEVLKEEILRLLGRTWT